MDEKSWIPVTTRLPTEKDGNVIVTQFANEHFRRIPVNVKLSLGNGEYLYDVDYFDLDSKQFGNTDVVAWKGVV